ncbi:MULTISPECIES: hypothetical protein [unclassified Coleofasciculus]|uniref:hypothetical protein n=1 Tax=unclassified Coleofasciculus TaxID=2692782 RepID=UPI00187F9745|nr:MULTISPECIES: hypothetical protein [unclassified Coleofasciculus]MBE9125986.1 hypothetical protein [Coleofasciculus sp. LEGE 07081]MBE9151180.1 hypothetical protein [Coleofasciculus sp. LEGE 07092]
MKHSDWLRITNEGENLCVVLRQQGYQCIKQVRRLSWQVSKGGETYLLIYLPAPVGGWTVLPNNGSPARAQLMSILQNSFRKNELETVVSHPGIRQLDDWGRPWAIVRLLSNAQRYTVARFYNRQDADDHQRTLSRFMPGAEFVVIFDPCDD